MRDCIRLLRAGPSAGPVPVEGHDGSWTFVTRGQPQGTAVCPHLWVAWALLLLKGWPFWDLVLLAAGATVGEERIMEGSCLSTPWPCFFLKRLSPWCPGQQASGGGSGIC